MRVALAQLNFTVGAFEQNYAKMAAAYRDAASAGADLVVFTELGTSGSWT